MPRIFWSLALLSIGLALVVSSPSRQTSDDTLRTALDAVTRKQRSLDSIPQDYYNELKSFKYHGEPDRKFDREELPEMDDDDDDLEFLPLENGQLENIGGGFQGFGNKRLERALIDYLETAPVQRESASSLFRERERTGNHKRTMNSDHSSEKELARLFLDELQNSPSYGDDTDDAEYMPIDALQQPSLYDRYRLEQNNKLDNAGPMSWSELFNKERVRDDDDYNFGERDRNQRSGNYVLYHVLPTTQRRNVNGRYPIGREYRDMVKRFPVAKRSAKAYQVKTQTTDPKVAQDLGALFGPQSIINKTQDRKSSSSISHMDHNHGTERHTSERPTSTTDVTSTTTGKDFTKEKSTKSSKISDHLIEVKKKSVDWSQYFGIDRRRKKAALLARPDSQEQDDEWMLQRYYKAMAENLKTPGKENDRNGAEKRDKLDQMDEKLKNVKNLIVEDAVRYSAADDNDDDDSQRIRDVVMARLAAAYSLEKMRRALNEFKNSIAAQKDVQRNSHKISNSSNGNKEDSNGTGNNAKRSSNVIEDEGSPYEGFDEGRATSCPELEAIERTCRPAKNLVTGLFVPCVMHQICRTCDDEAECMGLLAMEAQRVCTILEDEGRDSRGHCARTALVISQMQPPPIGTSLCHGPTGDSCLRRYQYRNRHRFSYPYASRRHNAEGVYDTAMKR